MKKNDAKLAANHGQGLPAKFCSQNSAKMTLHGVVFMSLAAMKRLGEQKSYHVW
jgi:hypothetical protein